MDFSFHRLFLCRTFAVPNDRGKWSSVGPKACLTSPVAREGPSCETEGIPERLRKMFTKILNFNTELCVDLKTILTSDRRAKMRKDYMGVLTRDGRDHFTFIEEAQERKTCRRHPMVYKGYCINVTRRPDGSLLPHFRLPQYSKYYTFKDFCREAAEELLMMAGLGEEE